MNDTPRTDKVLDTEINAPYARDIKFDMLKDHAHELERENDELQNEIAKLHNHMARLVRTNNALMAEVIEAMDDKARLDWLQCSDITLHHWDEGGIWCKSMIYTIRECIDREMEEGELK